MIEHPLFFGTGSNLLGIVSEPERPRRGAPAVLLLNAGLLHRVGPNRVHVDLARRLAELGFLAMRFDMSGVGDSDLPDGGGMLDIERSRQDVIEAMDVMRSRAGAETFVVMGLCTGAFNAFRAALIDERIVGAALLDGYSYPTWRSTFDHYRTRVLELDRWVRYVKRRLGSSASDTTGVGGDVIVFENEVVPRDRFAREMSLLVARDARLLLVYTGLGPLAYTYERQIFDALPDVDLDRSVEVRFYPKADHTFTLPGNRRRLLSDIETWLLANFGTNRPQPARAQQPLQEETA